MGDLSQQLRLPGKDVVFGQIQQASGQNDYALPMRYYVVTHEQKISQVHVHFKLRYINIQLN